MLRGKWNVHRVCVFRIYLPDSPLLPLLRSPYASFYIPPNPLQRGRQLYRMFSIDIYPVPGGL